MTDLAGVLSQQRLEILREIEGERSRLLSEKPEEWQRIFAYLGEQANAVIEAESLELDEAMLKITSALVGLMGILPDGDRRDKIVMALGAARTMKGDGFGPIT